ncbi:hypothetical protein ACWGNA_12380 [Brucella cytisi]|uniref:hypothetical protein n=1 Tax=Brucella cytisi TaxID=407152 RepID=UPI0035E3B3E1
MTLLLAWQHLFPDFGDVELLENIGSGQVTDHATDDELQSISFRISHRYRH